jgi:pimeloyl-ACP methyl ester carboxylesterase
VTDAKEPLPGFEERFAETGPGRLRYLVGGPERHDGPPLMLVHGLGGAASNWTELAPILAASRRVVVPELAGHGRSDPLPRAASLEPFADGIGAVAERERLFPAVLVGHSLGGVVALRLALRRPDDVTGVVLAAAAGISSGTRRARYALSVLGRLQPGRRLAPYRGRVARSRRLRLLVFGYWGVADVTSLSEQSVRGFMAGPELHTDTVTAARALVADDPRQELEAVHCPCLVLWGAADNQLGLEDAFDYARRLRAPLRVIADCGHLLIGERPDACRDAIESFLESVRPS